MLNGLSPGWWWALLLVLVAALATMVWAWARLRRRLREAEHEAGSAAEARRRLDEMNQRLARSGKLLDQYQTDLRMISQSVAHDLRNPLNTIGLNVHLLRSAAGSGDDQLATTAVDHVDRAKEQMVAIVDFLRTFSRVCFAPVDVGPVDMHTLARGVVEELRRKLDVTEVDVDIESLPCSRGDGDLMRIVLSNLLGDAVAYRRQAPPRARVEVGFEAHPEPGAYFVRDNGRGFPTLDPASLFVLFRPAGSAQRLERNAGLAARAVERQGGEMWARPDGEGGGSVYFRLSGCSGASGHPMEGR